MLKGFEGYYEPDFDKLWNEATFVFDANVLLDLYRSSPKSRKEMLDILESLDSRLWIPHQFLYEYHRNKLTIYDDIESNYEEWKKKLQEFKTLTSENLHNLLGNIKNRTGFEINSRDEELASLIEELLCDLAESKAEHQSSLDDEPLQEKIAQLFAGHYGDPFDDSCLEKIRTLAKERLKKGIPPGSKKDSQKDNSDPDGDLIGWLQTIKYAKENKKPIILVSNDGHWFLTLKGKTRGPYPELVQEMYEKAEVNCYIYKPSQFIKYAQNFLDAQVSEETIEEAQNRETYAAQQVSVKEQDEGVSGGSGRTGSGLLGFGLGGGFLPKLRTFDALARPSPETLRALDALAQPSPETLRALDALAQPSPETLRALDALAKPHSKE